MSENKNESPLFPDWNEDEYSDEEEICPYTEMMMSAILCGKPFGMLWPEDTMIDFLKKRNYKIVKRHDEDKDKDFNVAVKSGDLKIEEEFSNINKVFETEIQTIIINWLLKNG